MALNNFKRNHLMPLHFKGLMYCDEEVLACPQSTKVNPGRRRHWTLRCYRKVLLLQTEKNFLRI